VFLGGLLDIWGGIVMFVAEGDFALYLLMDLDEMGA